MKFDKNSINYLLIHAWKLHWKNLYTFYIERFSVFVLYKNTFMTDRLILWKSDNPDLITSASWKDFGLFVIIKSMQVGFMKFLKQVLSLTIFLQRLIWQKFFIVASFVINFSCCPSCQSRFLPIKFRWLAIKFFLGL